MAVLGVLKCLFFASSFADAVSEAGKVLCQLV